MAKVQRFQKNRLISFAFRPLFRKFAGMKVRPYIIIGMLLWLCLPLLAQHSDRSKMSPWVRRLATSQPHHVSSATGRQAATPSLCAFVLVDDDGTALTENGCRSLARFGNIHIADIPLNRLNSLSLNRHVQRIEARQHNQLHMDRAVSQVNATTVHSGQGLPQAYTGRGVVMGIMDVGFDLTHPNFFDATGNDYRIRALWDQISIDTLDTEYYVGADYIGREALLGYAHSRDGLILTHGTHTLGCAAGSGAGTAYRGMAPESDICLVNNAVSNDLPLIDSVNIYKYTYATDALGFKYIFDYADAHNQPCVISFSEGSPQDFRGYDILYNAVLDSLTAHPGHIIVSSAGNDGYYNTYFHKPFRQEKAGAFLRGTRTGADFTVKSTAPCTLLLKAYADSHTYEADISLPGQLSEEGLYSDTITLGNADYYVYIEGFPSCYNAAETVYEVMLSASGRIGSMAPFSIELTGADADIDFYLGSGNIESNDLDASLNAGEPTHSINSPGCSESVICVGGTTYSDGFTNYQGEFIESNWGPLGERGSYSSVGPTYDNRIKPDVMAPGIDVVSSLSSYYLEGSPEGSDVKYCTELFNHNDRTYAWAAFSGTSMSSPIVGGAIALWLEARPRLTRQQVMQVISETSTHPDPTLTYPNNLYGYGQIDVYGGLLRVLELSDVKGLSRQQPSDIRFQLTEGHLLTALFKEPPANPFTMVLFDTAGRRVGEHQLMAGQTAYTIDLATLPDGVYAVQVNASEPSQRGSTLIRIGRR